MIAGFRDEKVSGGIDVDPGRLGKPGVAYGVIGAAGAIDTVPGVSGDHAFWRDFANEVVGEIRNKDISFVIYRNIRGRIEPSLFSDAIRVAGDAGFPRHGRNHAARCDLADGVVVGIGDGGVPISIEGNSAWAREPGVIARTIGGAGATGLAGKIRPFVSLDLCEAASDEGC